MGLRLNGSTSGYTEVNAPAAAGNNTLTLPTGNGSARQILMGDGAGTLSFVNDAGALFYRLNADLAGANVNTAQSVFGVGVTLAASTVYGFEALYSLSKTAGTTSHTIGLSFAGTATLNNILYATSLAGNTGGLPGNDGSPQFAASNSASNFQATSTAGGTTAIQNKTFIIRGTISINAGGTLIPQYTCSAAPGGAYSTVAGSYIRFVPIGTAGSNSSQGTWS
jgi:hypothetical protein